MGLIQSAIPDPNKFLKAGSTGYDPSLGVVDLNTDTVSGQLNSILSKDNPLTARSDARVAQDYNRRGLINSSMGAQAAEAARIDTALPIAAADANTFSTQRLTNQAATNRASEFGAAASNTADLANAQAGNQFGLIGSQLGADINRILAQGAETRKTQAESSAQQQELAKVQGKVQAETVIPAETASRMAIQAQQIAGQSGLSAQESQQQQALAKVQGDIQSGLIKTQEQANEAYQQTLADIQTGKLLPAQTEAQKALAEQAGAIQSKLSAQQAAQSANLLTQQGQQAQDLERLNAANKITQLIQSGNNDLALQTLKGSQSVQLANIEASYKDLMQTSASAAQIFNVMQKNIAEILADPNTSVEQKQSAVNAQTQLLEASLAVQGVIANANLTETLDFTTNPITP